MRVLICGSRKWSDGEIIETVMSGYVACKPVVFVAGDATGADAYARHYAWEHKWEIEIFEAEWDRYGRAAGHIRNKAMLDSGLDRVVAFALDPLTPGTRDMIQQALGAKVVVHRVSVAQLPDPLRR